MKIRYSDRAVASKVGNVYKLGTHNYITISIIIISTVWKIYFFGLDIEKFLIYNYYSFHDVEFEHKI